MPNPKAVVVEETKADTEKIKKAMKLKKRYEALKSTAETMSDVATPTFIVSMLSPFDIEGPVIEIVTGATILIGIVLKKIAEHKLENLEGINTDGENYTFHKLDKEDSKEISESILKVTNGIASKRKHKNGAS